MRQNADKVLRETLAELLPHAFRLSPGPDKLRALALCLIMVSFSICDAAKGAGITVGGGSGSGAIGGIGGGGGGSGTYGGAGGAGGVTGGGGGGSGGKSNSTYNIWTIVGYDWNPETEANDIPVYGWSTSSYANSDSVAGGSGGAGGSYSGGGGGASVSMSGSNATGPGGSGASGSQTTVVNGGYWNGTVIGGSGGGGGGAGTGQGVGTGGTGTVGGSSGSGGGSVSVNTGGTGGAGGAGGLNITGGGGGGGGGSVRASVTTGTNLGGYTGGSGGAGGSGGSSPGRPVAPASPSLGDHWDNVYYVGGGGGGGGGAGLVVQDATGTITADANITGGAGTGSGGGGVGLVVYHVSQTTNTIVNVNSGVTIRGGLGYEGGAGVFLVGNGNTNLSSGTSTIGTAWGGTLNNSGTISGGACNYSYYAASGVLGNNVNINNQVSGTISGSGRGYGVEVYSSGVYTSNVDNRGRIEGYYGIGLSGVTGTVTNRSGATVSGSSIGVNMQASQGKIENDGSIYGGGTGISMSGNSGVINNRKEIEGGSTGVSVTGQYGEVNNVAGGTIDGGVYGVMAGGSNVDINNSAGAAITGDDTGVYLSGTYGLLDNHGDVDGGMRGVWIAGTNGEIYNQDGATIVSAGTGVSITGGNGYLENDSVITGGDTGVSATGANDVIQNNANREISGNTGIYLGGSGDKVFNYGSVTSTDVTGTTGVRTGGASRNAEIYNYAGATISGGSNAGVELGGDKDLFRNVGAVDVDSENAAGVRVVGTGGTVVNTITDDGLGSGTIVGGSGAAGVGVSMEGKAGNVHNDSLVAGTTGIEITAGGEGVGITNTVRGVVQGDAFTGVGVRMDGIGGELKNSNQITGNQGVVTGGRYVSITNDYYGVIQGTNAGGIGVGIGGDFNTMKNFGRIAGTAYGAAMTADDGRIYNGTATGTGAAERGVIEGTGGTGLLMEGNRNWLENSGRVRGADVGVSVTGDGNAIQNNAGGSISTATNADPSKVAILVDGDEVVIENAGTVGGHVGVKVNGGGGYVGNTGVIQGVAGSVATSVGVDFTGTKGVFENFVGGGVTGYTAVRAIGADDIHISNAGSVTGVAVGIVIDADGDTEAATRTDRVANLFNTGVVSGVTGVQAGGKNLTLVNEGATGRIQGASDDGFGVLFEGTGVSENNMLVNRNGGDISAFTAVKSRLDGVTVFNETGSTIAGTASRTDSVGVSMDGADNAVMNAGSVSGGRYGAELNGAGNSLHNDSGGRISGGNAVGDAGVGVFGDNADIFNAGDISGYYGVRSGGDGTHIVSTGSMTGTGGDAILLEGNRSTVELWEGFSFGGKVRSTGDGNALALGGAAGTGDDFDVLRIGSDFAGFEEFIKMGDAVWRLHGDAGADAKDWTVRDGGGLIVKNEGAVRDLVIDNSGVDDGEDNVFAALDFDGEYAGSIRGDGDLFKIGAGELTLSGDSGAFAGTAYVERGAMIIGIDADLGGDAVVRSGANSLAVLGRLGGDALVEGGGAELLVANEVGGSVVVGLGGLLTLDPVGRVGRDVLIENGARFAAAGRIGRDLTVQSGGGMSFLEQTGTLIVEGDFNFNTGAFMDVFINHSGTDLNSLIEVGGKATLGKGTIYLTGIEVPDDGLVEGIWTIVDAPVDGVALTDCPGPVLVSNTNYLFFDPTLVIDDTTVKIKMVEKSNPPDPGPFIPIRLAGDTHNQRETARILNTLKSGKLYNHLLLLGEHNDVNGILDQLSGEIHSTVRAAAAIRDRQFASLLRARPERAAGGVPDCGRTVFDGGEILEVDLLRIGSDGDVLAALNPLAWQPKTKVSVWAQAEGGAVRLAHDDNAAGGRLRDAGVAVGFERRIRNGSVAGIAFRYAADRLSLRERLSDADIDSLHLGGYVSTGKDLERGRLRLTVGAMGAAHFVDSERRAAFNSFDETLAAKYSSQTLGAFAELGWTTNLWEEIFLEPYLGLDSNLQRGGGFDETGGSAALVGEYAVRSRVSSTLGVRASAKPKEFLTLDLDAAWRLNYGNVDSWTDLHFSDLPAGGTMRIIGSNLARHEFTAGLGARIQPTKNVDVRVGYDATLGRRMVGHNGNVSMGMSF